MPQRAYHVKSSLNSPEMTDPRTMLAGSLAQLKGMVGAVPDEAKPMFEYVLGELEKRLEALQPESDG